MTDWLGSHEVQAGEISFNATISPLGMSSASVGHSSQNIQLSLPQILNAVSLTSFSKYFVFTIFPLYVSQLNHELIFFFSFWKVLDCVRTEIILSFQ